MLGLLVYGFAVDAVLLLDKFELLCCFGLLVDLFGFGVFA